MRALVVPIIISFCLFSSVAAETVVNGMRPQLGFNNYPVLNAEPLIECELVAKIAVREAQGEPVDAILWTKGAFRNGPDCSATFHKSGLTVVSNDNTKRYGRIDRPLIGPDGKIYIGFNGGCHQICLGGTMYRLSPEDGNSPELVYEWID